MASEPIHIPLPEGKKVFFASDFHLGVPDLATSHARERKIIRWLDSISDQAAHIFLLGDLFDFWFEYSRVVPKGFTRLLGKIANLTDAGIPVSVFTGNHDLGMYGYLTNEVGVLTYRHPQAFQIGTQKVLAGHGDGLGPGDHTYKLIKWLFEIRLNRHLFAALHPLWGVGFAHWWSGKSRAAAGTKDQQFFGENEWLWIYCRQIEEKNHHDCYVFGHRHLPMSLPVGEQSRYLNLGEWLNYCTYAVFDGTEWQLRTFHEDGSSALYQGPDME